MEETKLNENNLVLPVISQTNAIFQANEKIKEAMEEQSPGLICRWDSVNKTLGGCFRFGEVTYIAGPSGSGKSYILNMLREDFVGYLNEDYKHDYKILAFSFEMSAADEIIRTYSSRLKTSYSWLVSSEKKITKYDFENIKSLSSSVDTDKIFYVEIPGDRVKIEKTIESFHKRFPNHKLIITFDHTLLMSYLDEKSEVELVTKFALLSMAIRKKYNAMIIILGQLNDKIEQPERLKNPMMHFPKKTDIHGAKSVFFCSDNVIILNRPELLQLSYYGLDNWPTEGLIAWHVLKSRLYGNEGVIRMRQQFNKGTLIPYNENENKATSLFPQ